MLTIHLEGLARLCGDPFAVDVVDILLEEGGIVELQQSMISENSGFCASSRGQNVPWEPLWKRFGRGQRMQQVRIEK